MPGGIDAVGCARRAAKCSQVGDGIVELSLFSAGEASEQDENSHKRNGKLLRGADNLVRFYGSCYCVSHRQLLTLKPRHGYKPKHVFLTICGRLCG
jgi:hypothetical protein